MIRVSTTLMQAIERSIPQRLPQQRRQLQEPEQTSLTLAATTCIVKLTHSRLPRPPIIHFPKPPTCTTRGCETRTCRGRKIITSSSVQCSGAHTTTHDAWAQLECLAKALPGRRRWLRKCLNAAQQAPPSTIPHDQYCVFVTPGVAPEQRCCGSGSHAHYYR
jgi:hypothetical protein